jgi:hypothetical protein
MDESPDELTALVNHIEMAMDEINSAVIAARELEYEEVAPWLEWLGDELEDLLNNVLQAPPASVGDMKNG